MLGSKTPLRRVKGLFIVSDFFAPQALLAHSFDPSTQEADLSSGTARAIPRKLSRENKKMGGGEAVLVKCSECSL